MARSTRHLYTNPAQRKANQAAFTRRYGARGARVYGAVVGKVRREEVAAGTRSPREWVRGHHVRGYTVHRGGRRFHVRGHRVKGHYMRVR